MNKVIKIHIANTLYSQDMNSGSILRDARIQSGLSQVELGLRAGLKQSVISDYERGVREPGADVFIHLLELLGLTLNFERKRSIKVAKIPESQLGRLLLRNRSQVIRIAKDAGMTNVRVFGSVATGTTKKRSDIDLLVDLGKNTGLIELVDANQSMSQLLGVRVDLVSAAQLKPRVRDQVLREAIVL